MDDNNKINLNDMSELINNPNLPKFEMTKFQVPTFDMSYINKINEDIKLQAEERREKEAQRDEWLRTIAENVLAIKNNSDGLILSMEDLIQTIVVSNKITEANLLLIEQLLEKIKTNSKLNKIDEIKKATIGLSTQKGLEVGFVFLLKSLGIL